jgi:hypothetical protein
MIESGRYTNAAELSRKESANESYVCRMLRLTLLAPAIVQAILDGRQPATLEFNDLLKPLPVRWERAQADHRTMRSGPTEQGLAIRAPVERARGRRQCDEQARGRATNPEATHHRAARGSEGSLAPN